jgi:hypothetical protein
MKKMSLKLVGIFGDDMRLEKVMSQADRKLSIGNLAIRRGPESRARNR